MIPKEIQEIRFSKAMSGYKTDEVDDFCDKVYNDYIKFAELIKVKQEKIEALEAKLRDTELNADSINAVLISAQKLADSIVAEAKSKAEEIVETATTDAENIKQRTKKALEEIDAVITAQKNEAAKEAEAMLADAARKSEGMILAAKDSVAREQLLFDKLTGEVASFKKEIKNAYKTHLEALSALPEEVPVSPEKAAIAIEDIIRNEPDLRQFIEKQAIEAMPETNEPSTEATVVFPVVDKQETMEEVVSSTPLREVKSDMAAGFIVTPASDDE